MRAVSELLFRNGSHLALGFGVALFAVFVSAVVTRHFVGAAPKASTASNATRGPFEATFRLPGQPLDLVWQATGTSGYVSFGQGSIARLDLPQDPTREPRVTTVATGLRYPRGLAIVGKTLFVAELGPLPCRPAFPSCKGGDVKGESVEDTERNILRTSRGRVLAFDISRDTLSNRRVLLRGLPVANTDHGLNDLVRGPDGFLYLAIGHLDALYGSHKLTHDLIRPHADFLGTVVSFRPDGGGVHIYARGLRNVFGLAFDSGGHLFGSDNSGPTRHGYRPEELLRIERGADYGYPDTPRSPRSPGPLRLLQTSGSGGMAWVPDRQTGGRLILGSCGGLDSVPLTLDTKGRPHVAPAAHVRRLRNLPGCVTAIQPRPGVLVVALFTSGQRGRLYLVPLGG